MQPYLRPSIELADVVVTREPWLTTGGGGGGSAGCCAVPARVPSEEEMLAKLWGADADAGAGAGAGVRERATPLPKKKARRGWHGAPKDAGHGALKDAGHGEGGEGAPELQT